MSEFDNTNRGVLFRNDKQGNDKRPDYKGKANINGTDVRVSGWVRQSKDGQSKFLSLSFEPVEETSKPVAKKPTPVADPAFDDIDF